MQFNNVADIKKSAFSLAENLKRFKVKLSTQQCLEVLSLMSGYKSFEAASDCLQTLEQTAAHMPVANRWTSAIELDTYWANRIRDELLVKCSGRACLIGPWAPTDARSIWFGASAASSVSTMVFNWDGGKCAEYFDLKKPVTLIASTESFTFKNFIPKYKGDFIDRDGIELWNISENIQIQGIDPNWTMDQMREFIIANAEKWSIHAHHLLNERILRIALFIQTIHQRIVKNYLSIVEPRGFGEQHANPPIGIVRENLNAKQVLFVGQVDSVLIYATQPKLDTDDTYVIPYGVLGLAVSELGPYPTDSLQPEEGTTNRCLKKSQATSLLGKWCELQVGFGYESHHLVTPIDGKSNVLTFPIKSPFGDGEFDLNISPINRIKRSK